MMEVKTMKFLQERREIANAINIMKYPVITMDIAKPLNGDEFYKDCYGGSKMVVAAPTSRYPDAEELTTVMMFGDQAGNEDHNRPWAYKRIVFREGAIGIHADFGLKDVREMVEWNNAVHVKDGDKVVVFFDDGNRGWLRLMKVDRRSHTLTDIDE